MAALVLLEDANGAVCRERVYRAREEILAQDHDCFISCFGDPRTVLTELWSWGMTQPGASSYLCPYRCWPLWASQTGAHFSESWPIYLHRHVPAVWDGIISNPMNVNHVYRSLGTPELAAMLVPSYCFKLLKKESLWVHVLCDVGSQSLTHIWGGCPVS